MSANILSSRNAFDLGGEPTVMPNHLGVWGTSIGGGIATVAQRRIQTLCRALALIEI